MHLNLLIEYRDGKPIKEPVHVENVDGNTYRLLYSPGLVQGLAAGDIFTLKNEDGDFDVIERGGNVSVQVYAGFPIRDISSDLCDEVRRIGGILDGNIEKGLVFTIPISAGFSSIESVFNKFVLSHTGTEWVYGNIYDENDAPLNWWVD